MLNKHMRLLDSLERSTCLRFATLGVALALLSIAYPAKAFASNWYVSYKSSEYNYPPPNGQAWSSAWPDFQYITWSSIRPGDTIFVDGAPTAYGGAASYSTPLTVGASGTAGNPITIVVSTSTSTSGLVHLRNKINMGSYGYININPSRTSSTSTTGGRWANGWVSLAGGYYDQNPTRVPNFMVDGVAGNGITIGTGASNINLANLWIARCQYGINLSSANNIHISSCLIGDNQFDNIGFYPALANPGTALIQNSWLYGGCSNTYTPNGVATHAGIQPANNAANLQVLNCLMGPGLGQGIYHSADHTSVQAYGSLLVNPILNSISVGSPSGLFYGEVLASFQTPLNQSGQGNYCLALNNTQNDTLLRSIIYGGCVSANQNTTAIGTDNFQFRDVAATEVISAQLQDPQFISNVASVANAASFDTLCGLNFGLQATSPVLADPNVTSDPYFAGRVTSVSEYLQGVPQ